MRVCLREEKEYEECAAAAECGLEPEDYSPGAECDDYALLCMWLGGLSWCLEKDTRRTPRNGPNAGPIRVPDKNQPSAVARARGS